MRNDHRVSSLAAQSPLVELRDLWHRFETAADGWTLKGIDLQLTAGELVGLLGPSGCGKTTLLRLIAGFERPSKGEVHFQQRPVAGAGRWIPPERRGVGMVFQDYALFPHLTAWQNACFGLRRGQDDSRARWLLQLLGLEHLEQRYPHQLSGGQRQRLALARALAPAPQVVLLDEPFSNLDVEVRLRLRGELSSVLHLCGTSGLIVTHDPAEALAICDRVAVMKDGLLHQCAKPRDLVENPASAFVGRFVLQGNLLPVSTGEGSSFCSVVGCLEPLQGSVRPEPVDDRCVLVDPDAITLIPDPEGDACVMGREFLGHAWQYRIQVDAETVRVNLPLHKDHSRGLRGRLQLCDGGGAILFPDRIKLRAIGPCGVSGSPTPSPFPPA